MLRYSMESRILISTLQRAALLACMCIVAFHPQSEAADAEKPNVVIIFLDDAGYSDFHPFGDPPYPTPNVERLSEEGRVFTRFYVPQAVCSASRSVLMTGLYPARTRIFGALRPTDRGLDPKYPTLAEMLKSRGYVTGVFGKWHLGDQPETRPQARGFDETSGLMYSNDMWPANDRGRYDDHPLKFWKNGEVAIESVTAEDQAMLTTWYTEHAVDFIDRHKDEPFFLYLPHTMPHVPIFASEKFLGKSGAGLYGDVMMELDWSVGEVMKALDRNGVADNTLFIFTSDNGPWKLYGNHAGATPFRESKLTSFDGGVRSPIVMRFPGRIPPNSQSDAAFSSLDIVPTIVNLIGADMPSIIDGHDTWNVLTTDGGMTAPHEFYPISTFRNFDGILSGDGRWKLHLPHSYMSVEVPGMDGARGTSAEFSIETSLFDLRTDPLETENVLNDYPDIAEKLLGFAKKHYDEFYAPYEKNEENQK